MPKNEIVTHEAWIEARKALLAKEKEFSRLRDELTAARMALPWERVEVDYRFHGPHGEETPADLFADRSQLIVHHFMFETDWDEGCKLCSYIADHYEPSVVHLAHRDVTMVTVSRAPFEKLEAFRGRMGWNIKWLSSRDSDFNRDFGVSFTPEEIAQGKAYYNYREGQGYPSTEASGISAFYRDMDGTVYHTYSAYSRALENFITTYTLLDIVPKGRDEADLTYSMTWVRHKDRYEDPSWVDPYG